METPIDPGDFREELLRREARAPHAPPATAASRSDEYYLSMAALDRYPIEDGLPKSTSVVFRIHQLGHALEKAQEARPAPPVLLPTVTELDELLAWCAERREAPDFTTIGMVEAQIEALKASRPAPPLDWQPIATAPKGSWPDGPQDIRDPSYVEPPRLWLTLQDGLRCVGYFDAYYAEGGNAYDGEPPWVEVFSGERIRPTHWMPLPDPPAAVP